MPLTTIPTFTPGRFSAIAIGSSTGAPGLVEKMLSRVPADLPVPVFVAQHLPPQFTVTFAASIDRAGPLSAHHAEDGMPVYPGTVYVGVGRQHLRVRKGKTNRPEIEVSPDPDYRPFKPSVDELFRSLAKVYGSRTLAIVMTGIGRDGTEGARAIVEAGGMVVTQSAETCAVYGMPRSVVEAGYSTAALHPDEMPRLFHQLSPLPPRVGRV